MFALSSALYWYKVLFLTELLVSEFLATYTLNKKKRFALRVTVCVLCSYAIAFLYPIFSFSYNAVYSSIMFFVLFGVTVVFMKICYDETWISVIFCAIVAYTTQHMAYELYGLFVRILNLGYIGMEYGTDGMKINDFNIFIILVYSLSYFFTYFIVWAFVERRIRLSDNFQIEHLHLFVFSVVIVLVDIVLSLVVTYLPVFPGTDTLQNVISIYNLLSCALALGMQFSMLGKQLAMQELETVSNLWERDRNTYEMSKANIELINIKCHDLKHQIRSLSERGNAVDKEFLSELEEAIGIYDKTIKTGCEVLDIIIAEKSLFCEKNKIKLTAIVDGQKLNFISKSDLYSLFGNALGNALEAVMKTSVGKRIIRLKVMENLGYISIHIENGFNNKDLEFVDGLPQTTKKHKGYHGYGVRSMQLLAEKYGGGLTVSIENDMFNLDIVLPCKPFG